MLPPVPLDTKIDETNPKAHVMKLYPDLFDGVRTIKNAMVHLDVKPGAIPIVCSPRRVPDALRLIKGGMRQNGGHESNLEITHQ